MVWQVQEAKQRFSEVLRAVQSEGPQVITRHGHDVAVMVGAAEYRRLTSSPDGFVEHLKAFPRADAASDVWDEIAAERSVDLPRDVDLGTGA